MLTSARSRPADSGQIEFPWTSSAEDSLARISALQELVRDLLASDPASGGNTPASSKKSGRAGPSSKTSAPFALAAWTSCSGASLRSGMMRSGTAYPLPPLARLTRETESGLLPTPRAEGHDAMGKDASKSSLVAQRNWPTPTARCANSPSETETRQGAEDLQTAVQKWPTPTARDYKSGKHQTQTQRGRTAGPSLAEAVTQWPTPQARDHRIGTASRKGDPARHGGWNLNDWVASPETGGALNPTWVEWLMGFPLGWTAFTPSATASSPKSPS